MLWSVACAQFESGIHTGDNVIQVEYRHANRVACTQWRMLLTRRRESGIHTVQSCMNTVENVMSA